MRLCDEIMNIHLGLLNTRNLSAIKYGILLLAKEDEVERVSIHLGSRIFV